MELQVGREPAAALSGTVPSGTTALDVPEWRPFAREFPHWHVWRGINGLLYGRRAKSSPPLIVRGEDPAEIRDLMLVAESRR
jgi:hypothetical protein